MFSDRNGIQNAGKQPFCVTHLAIGLHKSSEAGVSRLVIIWIQCCLLWNEIASYVSGLHSSREVPLEIHCVLEWLPSREGAEWRVWRFLGQEEPGILKHTPAVQWRISYLFMSIHQEQIKSHDTANSIYLLLSAQRPAKCQAHWLSP